MIIIGAKVIGHGPFRPDLPTVITPEKWQSPGELVIAVPIIAQTIEQAFWHAERLRIWGDSIYARVPIDRTAVDWLAYETQDEKWYFEVRAARFMRELLDADFKLFWWPHVLG